MSQISTQIRGTRTRPEPLDADLADIRSANAIIDQMRAFDGDMPLPETRSATPEVREANRMLRIADAERTLQDPKADHDRYFNAARMVMEERGREAVAAHEARARRAQSATEPGDLSSRILELHAQYGGNADKVTEEIVREGWDGRLITPKMLADLDTQIAQLAQPDPNTGRPIDAGNSGPMLAVLKEHLMALRTKGFLREGENPGAAKVPAQMPVRVSVSGFGGPELVNQALRAQDLAKPQGERSFAGEQVAAAGRAVGGATDAVATWLGIAGDKVRNPVQTMQQIQMLTPIGWAKAIGNTAAEKITGTNPGDLDKAVAGKIDAAVAPVSGPIGDAVQTAGGVMEMAGGAVAGATRPSPSVATGNWRSDDGSIAWKTIASQLTETTTQLGMQITGGAAATMATGNPAVGVVVGAAIGSGMDTGSVMRETFTQQVQSGQNVEDARATAATVGAVYAPIAAMLEYIPMEEYLSKSPAGKEAKRQLVGIVASKVGKALAAPAKEGVTEVAQEAWQDFSQWAIANDSEAFNDWQARYAKVGVLGAVAGGGAKVTTAAYNRVMDTTPARGESVEPSKPLAQMTPEELAAAKAARAPRVQQDLPKVIGAIAQQNGLTAGDVGITADADLTPEQKRVADLGNELGVDVVYIDGGKELDTASAVASRAGLVVIDRNASGTNAAESLLQHEVVHELRGRLKAAGREGEWSKIVEAIRGADTEGFDAGKAQYGKVAEAAGLKLDDDTATEEGVAVAAQEGAVAGFLRATVDDGDILAFVNRAPNTAERMTDAIQRTLRKVGLFNRRTLLENLRGKVSEARVYRELRSAMSILRETARSIPLTNESVGSRAIPVVEDSTVDPGIPLVGREIGETIPLGDGETRRAGPTLRTVGMNPLGVEGEGSRVPTAAQLRQSAGRSQGLPVSAPENIPVDTSVPLVEGRGGIPVPTRPGFVGGDAIPLAEREPRVGIPLADEQQPEQVDTAALQSLRASKPKPLTKKAIESMLVEKFRAQSETAADVAMEVGDTENLIGTGANFTTFYKKVPTEIAEEMKGNPQLMRRIRVTNDPGKAGGDDAMADMGADAYLKMLMRDSSAQVEQAKQHAQKNKGGDPEAAFFAALLDRLPKGKMRADTVAPSELEVGDEFTVAGVPVRVELRGTGEMAYRVLVDHGDLPVTPVDAMDSGVPVDPGTLEKGEYGVEGEGAAMPEEAMLDPGDDLPFALRRRGDANQAADIAGQQGLYGQGTTRTGEKQGGLFGAVAEEPRLASQATSEDIADADSRNAQVGDLVYRVISLPRFSSGQSRSSGDAIELGVVTDNTSRIYQGRGRVRPLPGDGGAILPILESKDGTMAWHKFGDPRGPKFSDKMYENLISRSRSRYSGEEYQRAVSEFIDSRIKMRGRTSAQYPLSPEEQREGESDADYRIRMKFREAERNTAALFALRNPSGRRFRDEGAQLRGAVGAALREPAGMQTIGRPDLANPGRTEAERRVVNAADSIRTPPAAQQVQEWIAAADDRLKADRAGEKQALMDKVNRGELLDSTETVIGQTLVADAALNILSTGDEAAFVEAMRIHNAYRQSGTDWARAGVARRDRVETPAERHARFIGQILAEPDPQTRKQLDKATQKFRTATNPATRGGAKLDIDRLLERQAKTAQKIRQNLLAAGIDPATISDQTIADPETAARIARVVSSSKAGIMDKVSEYWINSIISGPQTQAANIIGNAAYGGWETLIQRGVEGAAADAARLFGMDAGTGANAAPTLREYKAMAKATAPALARAGRNFLAAWRREVPILEDEIAVAGGETGAGSKLELPDSRAKIGGKTGRAVRALGTRQLLAFDEFFKGLWGTLDVHARSYRMALAEGLKGEAAWNRAADLTNDMASDAWAESLKYAENVAFQSENELANQVVKGRQWVNETLRLPVGTFIIPFVKTPLNILKGAAEKTPLATAQAGLHLARGDYRDNPALLARDVANNMVGWGLAALLTAAVGGDDDEPWITGATSPDRGEREMQYRQAPPMSVRVGDSWVSYARIEPFATVLGTMVDTIKRAKRSGSMAEGVASVTESLKNQVEDKTFLQGLSDIFAMLDKQGSANQKAAQWASGFATSWVPNIIRQPTRATDPMLRERRIRETDEGGVWESAAKRTLQNLLPIGTLAPPPKVDRWGREVSAMSLSHPATDIPYRMLVPIQQRTTDDNAIDRMITVYNSRVPDDQRWFPTVPSPIITRTVNGERVTYRMTDEEYNTFLRVSGQNAHKRLMRAGLRINNPTERDMDRVKEELRKADSEGREYILRSRR